MLFATAIIAFAVPARAGAENRPSMETCIAYAEAEAALWPALEEHDAAMKEDKFIMERIKAAIKMKGEELIVAKMKEDEPALREGLTHLAELVAETDQLMARVKERMAGVKEIETELNMEFLSIYRERGGVQSSVESIMVKLAKRDRAMCRVLYGI